MSSKFQIKRWEPTLNNSEPHIITDVRLKYKEIIGRELPNNSKIVFKLLHSEYCYQERGRGYMDRNVYEIEVFEGFYNTIEKGTSDAK